MHSLISKCTFEMCSLIKNALLNLLNLPLNYLGKHSLPNCLYVYSDVGGVISSVYTLNAQVCRTRHVKMCSLKNPWENPEVEHECSSHLFIHGISVVHTCPLYVSANMNFLTADGLKFSHPLHHLGKSASDLPVLAIDSFRHMYIFPKAISEIE